MTAYPRFSVLLILTLLLTVFTVGCDEVPQPPQGPAVPSVQQPVQTPPMQGSTYSIEEAETFCATSTIPVIPWAGLGDYMSTLDSYGQPVIYYDPTLPYSVDIQTFFLAHEYGHHFLRHIQDYPGAPDWLAQLLELEADRFAVRALARTDPGAVQSMISAFWMQTQHDARHPDGPTRAQSMQQALQEALSVQPTQQLQR